MDKQDVLLARQPIYSATKSIVGYELLFREGDQIVSTGFDGNRATSRVLLSLFTESDLATVTGGLPAFINFTEELISHPPLFDPQSVVIEILEDIDVTEALITNVKALKEKGYTLALDDFVMDTKYAPLLGLIDIVKLELPEMDQHQLAKTITELKKYNVKLLAEKVETPEQFKQCVEYGCDMFQGYFLSKPEVIKGTKLSTNKLVVINLISEIQAPEVDMQGLTQIITRDPGLSFKLLKLINSAAFRRSREIESIHKAVTLLGIDKIKSWASLLALSKIDDKPQSLHYLALVRAMMCEKLAEKVAPEYKDRFYTIGLLSCLDAFFDQELSFIVKQISLDKTITEALLEYNDFAGLILKTTICFEQSDWNSINWQDLAKLNLTARDINEIYFESSRLAVETQRD